MTNTRRITLLSLVAVLSCALFGPALMPQKAEAAYNQSNLIDNVVYINSNSMNQAQIQAFLVSKGSWLSNYSSASGRNNNANALASQIIYEAAQDYAINPQVLLATMQKEQSLITDPNPDSSQVTYAMGYGCPDSGSCSYPGFWRQVDAAAWQFRYNYEAINGRAWGGHPATSYPCRAATRYYAPGLYAGNHVTFYNEAGAAYRAFTIANAATASLYCYTPHVGPYSQTGYSGSYNFVTNFESWFGSTQTTIPYAWAVNGYGAYVDSGRAVPYANSMASLAPGATAYYQVKALNSGTQTWNKSVVRLGTNAPQNHLSPFADSSWLNGGRIEMQEASVAPGGTATFNFSMKAPSTPGAYLEQFNIVADGLTWMNDPGLAFRVTVVNPITPDPAVTTVSTLPSGSNSLSGAGHYNLAMRSDGNLSLLNNGNTVWQTGTGGNVGARFVQQSDCNLVVYSAQNAPLWSSGTSGTGTNCSLKLQPDGNLVLYRSEGGAVWSSGTSTSPGELASVNEFLSTAGQLFPGQKLETPDRKYALWLQGDGNIVLYNNSTGQPLWSSGTAGRSASFLANQGDGNLVLYSSSGVPLWNSRTAGRMNSALWLQTDGNLVLYNSQNTPTWTTNTVGR